MSQVFSEKTKKLKNLLFLLIILTGVGLRFYYALTNAYFVNDQGRDLMVLQKMLERGYPVTIGPSTSFFTKYGNLPFGPYYYYFLFPFFLISKHPYFFTSIFIILFALISLWITNLKILSFAEKLIFLLFFTFSLNSIYHTTFIWNLNLAMLLGFILYLVFLTKKEKIFSSKLKTFFFAFILGAIFQIHYALFFLFVGILLIIAKEKTKKVPLFLLGFIISFFPFVIFDLRHNFLISKMLFRLPFETKENRIGINFIQTIIDLSKFYFPFLIKFNLLHLILGLLFSSLLLFYPKRFFTKLFFAIFFLTFILLRRNFTYYLALYLPFFYFQIATLNKKRIFKIFLLSLALITSLTNLNRFFKEENSKLGIKTQIRLAERIKQNNKDKTLSLTAIPHPDDRKGVEYLLSVLYKFKIDYKDKDKYIICYEKNLCPNKKIIFEGKKIRLVYYRE